MGTTMASFSIDDLIRGSDAIIVGKVGESELRQPDADNMGVRQISTLVRVSVDTVVATRELSIGEMIRIQLAGGRKGKYVTAVMGTPNLNQGDRYVFFLKHGIGDYYGIVGMSQGVRLILSEGSGRKIRTCLLLICAVSSLVL